MKKITTLFFLFASFISFSQSNLTVFNNGGQQFYVILNGIKQNSVPMTNVSISGVKNGSYSIKLIFADGKTGDIDKNFIIEEPSDITTSIVFKKGKGKLRLINMQPANGTATDTEAITFRQDNNSIYSDAPIIQTIKTEEINTATTTSGNGGVTIQQTGTAPSGTTQNGSMNVNVSETQNGQGMNQNISISNPNNPNEKMEMNVNVNVQDPTIGGENINMSVNMNGVGNDGSTQSQTSNTQITQTITTTTTTTTSGTQINSHETGTTSSPEQPVYLSISCKNILGDGDAMVIDLNNLILDDDRKEFIKSGLKDHCLTASQAYKIVETISFDDDRLEISKYLYDRMIDKDQGRTLMLLFNSDQSKLEFRDYMRK